MSPAFRCGATGAIAVLLLSQVTVGGELASALRRPVGLAISNDEKLLYVSNRDSGTLSVIDIAGQKVVAEQAVGERLSDVAAVPGSDLLLATDEAAHQLVVLDTRAGQLSVRERLPVSPYPVSIQVAPDGRWASIASLWSRRLTFVDLGEKAELAQVVDLPFAPRSQLLIKGRETLLVADSFGGRLALVDLAGRKLRETRQFPGHNVRGLGVSPDGKMLVVAHQLLNELAHSIRNDIHWGLLMSNDLRWLEVDSVLAGGKGLYHGAHMHPLGEAGKGGGDPGGLDIAASGMVCVAISGVNQVAIGKEGDFSMQRLNVGRRPTAVRISRDGKTAFVANTLGDSISMIDLDAREVAATIPLGPAPELSLTQRGELLFYDARLSHDGWMSCQSCHTEGHANGEMNDNFSDRSFGAPKRVLSLLNVRDTLPLAWNGQVPSLAQQIGNSIDKTMQREEPLAPGDVEALAAYVETLELPPPLDLLRGVQDSAAIDRGRVAFEKHNCSECHSGPTYTSPQTYEVGLRDAEGNTEFNPPSLRGLSHRGPYLHDNRAATLEEVFAKHQHPSGTEYPADELRDLVAFLRSL